MSPPHTTYPSSVDVKKETTEDSKFHNPALAAIRASQQLQEPTDEEAQNTLDASIQALRELADQNGRPDLNPWYNMTGTITATLQRKRRLSQVSEFETQPGRTNPAIDPLPSIPLQGTAHGVAPPAHNYAPKRRPDPNDDTIGSDLDDSEEDEDIASEDDDEDMPLMLCSYDKVHRTKNKWRANLANGVVCINGREWVFEKANGEYEW
jgi:hypothetical protein